MAKVRGSASWSARAIVAIMAVSVLLLHADYVQADTYRVGDDGGWTFNVVGWPNGKQFKAADDLVFIYYPDFHDVVRVDSEGYNSCQKPEGAVTYTSGHNRLTLFLGDNFFISSFPGDCESGVKIAVTGIAV